MKNFYLVTKLRFVEKLLFIFLLGVILNVNEGFRVKYCEILLRDSSLRFTCSE